ncbi:transglycosylase SLT domain-containing protein [Macromonas nakdongensis]|uniref:transglycosylase SLT domain-containing protein n=1 Tax=Macromonas nakdongensis TaxID=1843082 RepID=UPI000C323A37|nr:transglycosylase SLT domain-containing protein [Macromonas nakdongensis]
MTFVRLTLSALCAALLSACTTLPQPETATRTTAQAAPGTPTATVAQRPAPSARSSETPLQTLAVAGTAPSSPAVASLQAPKDLWERMRRGFAMPDLEDHWVRDRENWYASRPDYIQRMTDRGSKYLFHVVEELERRNLPQELALLPFIESAFNPQAVSHAKAAGMWQFMPATGRDFDLKQNAFRDDRRDVLASTRAALDYLERLHRMFGDWHLALAAYNWGEGNVMRAIKRNQAAGLGTAYLDLRMPDETRQYVPKLQAVKNIVLAPQRFQVGLPTIGNHPFFDSVGIDRDIDVALVAELADVSEKDFRQLNPSHNKPVIMAAGTPTILLPWDNALLFERRLREHKGPTASWTVWRVPSHMSAAAAAQRHGLSESELRDINKIPPKMLLKAGSTVLVPRQGKLDADVPEHIADNGQILFMPERPPLRRVQVKVKAGENLAKFAKRQRVTVADLREWNQLKANATLRSGQTLVVLRPHSDKEAVAQAKGKTKGKVQTAQASQGTRKTAQKGTSRRKTEQVAQKRKGKAKPERVAAQKSAVTVR